HRLVWRQWRLDWFDRDFADWRFWAFASMSHDPRESDSEGLGAGGLGVFIDALSIALHFRGGIGAGRCHKILDQDKRLQHEGNLRRFNGHWPEKSHDRPGEFNNGKEHGCYPGRLSKREKARDDRGQRDRGTDG